MSAHNHIKSYKPAMLENIDAAGLSDPLIRAPYPREAQDPAEFFSGWVEDMDAVPEVKEPGIAVVKGTPSYLHIARTWWELRDRPNVLLLHYNDLKADLDGEMRRIGRFLGVAIDEDVWPSLVEAARFESMKRDAELLSPGADAVFEGGAATFFHKGTNGRWKGVVRESDLAEYDRKLATLDPVLREWLTKGRLASGVL
ncbi:P-loop containing nucleoside triphosphate hydrolase protein [Hyaloraphidium curvatum]|nr:P-loop containing nucleoside triphosphate hydrolase protein [Hyaloraphidium curvatum]